MIIKKNFNNIINDLTQVKSEKYYILYFDWENGIFESWNKKNIFSTDVNFTNILPENNKEYINLLKDVCQSNDCIDVFVMTKNNFKTDNDDKKLHRFKKDVDYTGLYNIFRKQEVNPRKDTILKTQSNIYVIDKPFIIIDKNIDPEKVISENNKKIYSPIYDKYIKTFYFSQSNITETPITNIKYPILVDDKTKLKEDEDSEEFENTEKIRKDVENTNDQMSIINDRLNNIEIMFQTLINNQKANSMVNEDPSAKPKDTSEIDKDGYLIPRQIEQNEHIYETIKDDEYNLNFEDIPVYTDEVCELYK